MGGTGFKATCLGIGDLADRGLGMAACVATLQHALSFGLNLVDTAPSYEDGFSEEVVGAALRGRREGVFVIDKIDHWHEPVAAQVEGSLARLQMDHTDLFVFHGLSRIEDWERLLAPGGGMEQLDRCERAGKTRFKGLSSHDPLTLVTALESGLCDVVMFPVGAHVNAGYLRDVLPLARRLGVGTVCFKTFGAGKLVADTRGYGRPVEGRAEVPSHPTMPHLGVAECVRFTLTCDPDVALLGMSSVEEVELAVRAALAFEPLNAGEVDEITGRAAAAVAGKGRCHWDPQ